MSNQEAAYRHAQHLSSNLNEFRDLQFSVVSLIEDTDGETMEKEQAVLNQHDDNVDDLTIRIEELLTITLHPDPCSTDCELLRVKRKLTTLGRVTHVH